MHAYTDTRMGALEQCTILNQIIGGLVACGHAHFTTEVDKIDPPLGPLITNNVIFALS